MIGLGPVELPVQRQSAGIFGVGFGSGQQYALDKALALFGVQNRNRNLVFTQRKDNFHGVIAGGFQHDVRLRMLLHFLHQGGNPGLVVAEIDNLPLFLFSGNSRYQIVLADVDADKSFGQGFHKICTFTQLENLFERAIEATTIIVNRLEA